LLSSNNPTSTSNLSPTAANNYGPAVIISLSSQALGPETEAGGTAVVIGQRPERPEGITEADRQRLSQLSTLNGINSSDNRDTTSLVRNLDLEGLFADFNTPDEVHIGEDDGKVKQQFSTERAAQAVALVKRLRGLVDNPQIDPSTKAKAIQAMNLINESPLGKTIAATQRLYGIDLDGLAEFLQTIPPGQALEYTAANDTAGDTVLVTAKRLSVVNPSFGNGSDIPYVNPPLPTIGLPEIEIPYTEMKFETEADALNAGVAEINKHPEKNRLELGFYIYKDAQGKYRVDTLKVGVPDSRYGGKIPLNTAEIPRGAVSWVHTHPDGLYSADEDARNNWPSSADRMALNTLAVASQNPNFSFWIIGTDGVPRNYNSSTPVPSNLDNIMNSYGRIPTPQVPQGTIPVDYR